MISFFIHPQLNACRRLFLHDYEVLIYIGVDEYEKKHQQRVLIHVDLFIPLALSSPCHDLLAEVIDYNFIRDTITRITKDHIHLQETLCDNVLNAMLAHPKVYAARVSTEKPDVYPDCGSVGVEVFRIKDTC